MTKILSTIALGLLFCGIGLPANANDAPKVIGPPASITQALQRHSKAKPAVNKNSVVKGDVTVKLRNNRPVELIHRSPNGEYIYSLERGNIFHNVPPYLSNFKMSPGDYRVAEGLLAKAGYTFAGPLKAKGATAKRKPLKTYRFKRKQGKNKRHRTRHRK